MKKTSASDPRDKVETQTATSDDLLPEYEFDYRKARPNRFATRGEKKTLTVLLDADVAEVFTTPEAVNKVLPITGDQGS
jgi:hypothetical protein